MKRANFFILGAPKCGTTSLSSWLSKHPEIYITNPKEPRYFNQDFILPNRPKTFAEYQRLYKNVKNEHIAVGEATTGYLMSNEAVPAILRYNPTAKFIVCIRNPIEMVPSLHAQRIKEGIESETSLEKAWSLQARRESGKNIPALCTDPKLLLYGKICSLGKQLHRLYKLIPQNRVIVIVLDDLKRDPARVFKEILKFLGIDDTFTCDFPTLNQRMIPRIPILSQYLRFAGLVKKKIRLNINLGVGEWIGKLNNKRSKNGALSYKMKYELKEYYYEDVCNLCKLLNRDLMFWVQ